MPPTPAINKHHNFYQPLSDLKSHILKFAQVKELELTVENRETLVMELQKVHEQQLQKLSTLTEDRSQQWQQEKKELEEHYSKLLAQVHDRQKVGLNYSGGKDLCLREGSRYETCSRKPL